MALRVVGIRLRGGCRGHIRAAGRDRLDVAGRVVGIVEAAAARAERIGRARQTRTHPVAAVILRDDRVGIAAGVDRGRAPVLVGHSDRLFLKLAQVIVLVLRRDVELVRDRGRDGADRAVDRAVGRAVGLDAGVGILLPVKARAELPRLRRHAVGGIVHMLRGLDERAVGRRLARMDEPAEAVVLVAVLLRDRAAAVRGILPRKVVVAAVVVVVCCTVIIRSGALPVKRVIGVADTVAVAVGHRGQAAVVDAPIVAIGREGDGGSVPRLLLARGADLHARHVAEGIIVQQVVLPEARRAQIPFADEVAQLRAVVGIADGGDTVDVREGGAVAAGAVAVILLRAVGRRRPVQARSAGVVCVPRCDAVDVHGLRAEAAGAVVDVLGLEIVPAVPLARHARRGAAGTVVVGVIRQAGQRILLQVVACVVPQRVLCAAGRGIALETLGVREVLARRFGAAVRRRDGVALAVVAVGLRRFEHEADVREICFVGVVVIGAAHRDLFDPLVALARHDDARCKLPARVVPVEAHVLVFGRAVGIGDLCDKAKIPLVAVDVLAGRAADARRLAPAGEQERRLVCREIERDDLMRARVAGHRAADVHGLAVRLAGGVLVGDRVFVGGPEVRFSVDELRESAVLHQIDLGRGLALFEQQVIAIGRAVRLVLQEGHVVCARRFRREGHADLFPAAADRGVRLVVHPFALPRRAARLRQIGDLVGRERRKIHAAARIERGHVARVHVAGEGVGRACLQRGLVIHAAAGRRGLDRGAAEVRPVSGLCARRGGRAERQLRPAVCGAAGAGLQAGVGQQVRRRCAHGRCAGQAVVRFAGAVVARVVGGADAEQLRAVRVAVKGADRLAGIVENVAGDRVVRGISGMIRAVETVRCLPHTVAVGVEGTAILPLTVRRRAASGEFPHAERGSDAEIENVRDLQTVLRLAVI